MSWGTRHFLIPPFLVKDTDGKGGGLNRKQTPEIWKERYSRLTSPTERYSLFQSQEEFTGASQQHPESPGAPLPGHVRPGRKPGPGTWCLKRPFHVVFNTGLWPVCTSRGHQSRSIAAQTRSTCAITASAGAQGLKDYRCAALETGLYQRSPDGRAGPAAAVTRTEGWTQYLLTCFHSHPAEPQLKPQHQDAMLQYRSTNAK